MEYMKKYYVNRWSGDGSMKVTVLMSTYNGETYLEAQLESLIRQQEVEVDILVRDDGSTDSTKDILDSYSKKGYLSWYDGSNLGPAQSFLDLVRSSQKSDYYAYCDQDDVWFDDKLSNAVKKLDKFSNESPSLYVSTYDVVNENLDFIIKRDMKYEVPYTLANTIVERSPSGCTMVFNNKVRELIAENKPKNIRMHDYWTLLIVEAFEGHIEYDSSSRLLYRQHQNNSVGFGKGRITYIKRLIKSALYNKNERQKQAIELFELYKNRLPNRSVSTLLKVVNYRNTLSNRFKLAFDSEFKTPSFKINILFKISVILGLF